MKHNVTIYTDGACSGNPGPGGWAAILIHKDLEKELYGYVAYTTNNRMELLSAIEGLKALKTNCDVTLYSDSSYLCKAFNDGWLSRWKRNDWKGSSKQTVANQDLWLELSALADKHTVSFIWVKGHSTNSYNNRCDELATTQIQENASKPVS